ncbi:MAG: DNA-directed RNA polymerase subunit K [Candidatus Thermoplasmatota archaeon]|nr:DNA-directed RNA polymerase subunit K [Candidatus Thermoplasmatota archaeon]
MHYTRFEKARIIGARALQITMGAPLLIKQPKGKGNPVELALIELNKGVIPMTVKRKGKIIKGPVV